MSNELSAARGIGSSISKGTGSIPTLKFKKPKDEKTSTSAKGKPASPKTGKSGRKEIFEGTIIEPSATYPTQPESEIIDAEIVETPRSIGAPKKALGGGQRWDEFKSYVEANKAGKLSPPTKLD